MTPNAPKPVLSITTYPQKHQSENKNQSLVKGVAPCTGTCAKYLICQQFLRCLQNGHSGGIPRVTSS